MLSYKQFEELIKSIRMLKNFFRDSDDVFNNTIWFITAEIVIRMEPLMQDSHTNYFTEWIINSMDEIADDNEFIDQLREIYVKIRDDKPADGTQHPEIWGFKNV